MKCVNVSALVLLFVLLTPSLKVSAQAELGDFLSGQVIEDKVFLEHDYQKMLDSITTLNGAVTELNDSIATLNGITLDESSSEDSFPADAQAFFSGDIPIGGLGDEGFFFGYKFDVELDINVHGLGVFHPYGIGFYLDGDETSDFFTGNNLDAEVRLFSETGELIASAVVEAGPGLCDYSSESDPTASEYSYEAISAVTLSAGSTYYLIMKTGPGVFFMSGPGLDFDFNAFSNVSSRQKNTNGADFDSYNPLIAEDYPLDEGFIYSCNMLFTPF
jgi:hypothetical protein